VGQDLSAGQGGRQWSSPEWRSTVEAVVQPGVGMFLRGGGAWSPAVSSDDSCGRGRGQGGELHATTEGRRESTCGGGYHRSSEERR
jgi:hypothetical protein